MDNLSLNNLDDLLPKDLTDDQRPHVKTALLRELSLRLHRFYNGKMMTIPKAGFWGPEWFNVWYTPGVSKISTTIRENSDASFDLSNRANLVAVVSDSTRVLGDGDCSPAGGLGVMEGKAFLMKYLAGVDAIALCVNNRTPTGEADPERLIQFVQMLEPSVGAVNLEDIAQPNCYKILDTLQETCDIPVWHDDAQGTGCVTLAGFINALKVVEKEIHQVKIVLFGAGASNTTIARLLLKSGADPEKMILIDAKGPLHRNRYDIQCDPRFYRKWELCTQTNPECINSIEQAIHHADALIALSKPGPNVILPQWIQQMNCKPIVFACANPVPEIYPHIAKAAGAYVVATGRGDFPNQVNNSIGFPGILKGALLVRAKKITDNMAIAAAQSLALAAERRGLSPDYIVPRMEEEDIFPEEAKAVALQAIADGIARKNLSGEEVAQRTKQDIRQTRQIFQHLIESKIIPPPPPCLFHESLQAALNSVRYHR